MIEINLLPEDIKAKLEKSGAAIAKFQYVIYFIAFVIVVVLLLNFYFFIIGAVTGSKVRSLEKEWSKISPQKNNVENTQRETQGLSEEAKALQDQLLQRISWSYKLRSLSFNLAGGIWLKEVSYSNKDLIIHGCAVSQQGQELRQINQFIGNLKKDAGFIKNFKSLELSSVTRDKIGNAEIMNFVLTGKLN
jgi:Tfp pilus assembly protein PilN